MSASFCVVKTAFGWVGFVMDAGRLLRLYLPEADARAVRSRIAADAPDAPEDPQADPRLARDLADYFAGRRVSFRVAPAWDDATAFTRRVWQACAKIPYGQVLTYAQLAAEAGRPGAARAVGNAMRCNRWPIVVPCHRVLASGGRLGGYSGAQGPSFKRRLLELEAAGGDGAALRLWPAPPGPP